MTGRGHGCPDPTCGPWEPHVRLNTAPHPYCHLCHKQEPGGPEAARVTVLSKHVVAARSSQQQDPLRSPPKHALGRRILSGPRWSDVQLSLDPVEPLSSKMTSMWERRRSPRLCVRCACSPQPDCLHRPGQSNAGPAVLPVLDVQRPRGLGRRDSH